MRKLSVVHPFLFALYPVLFIFSRNISELELDALLIPATLVLASAVLLLLMVNLCIRDYYKAAMLTSLYIMLFFSYGPVWHLISYREIFGYVVERHRYLLVVWVMLLGGGTLVIIMLKKGVYNLTKVLNLVAAVCIIPALITIVTCVVLRRPVNLDDLIKTETVPTGDTSGITNKLPDIYYIIFDRYASAGTLKDIYGFDNKDIINYLSGKGFYIASQSNANYLKTAHSLASSLNMEYINSLSEKMKKRPDDWTPLFTMLQDHKTQRFLKSKGYEYIQIGSYYVPTRENKYADKNINYNLPNYFLYMLYQNTVLYPFLSSLDIARLKDERRLHFETTLWQFEAIANIPLMKEKKPVFVFAHMLIPHRPFVFDEYGNYQKKKFVATRNDNLAEKEKEQNERYVQLVKFVNKEMIKMIDKILSRSKTSPIIIIQADEGPFPIRYVVYGDEFNWKKQATDREIKQKYGILNAYYLPGIDKKKLYPSITPVNSFRLVFNLYFKTQFKLLPDENYAFKDNKHLYSFFSITDKLKKLQ